MDPRDLGGAPADISLVKLEVHSVGELDAPFRLKDALASCLADYDTVPINTPPTLGIMTVNAPVAANYLLLPLQASYYAPEGTDDLLETLEAAGGTGYALRPPDQLGPRQLQPRAEQRVQDGHR
jgi:cellulose biosynthesis protein BcsQ